MAPFDPEGGEGRGRRDLLLSLFFVALSGILFLLPLNGQQQLSWALRSSVLAPFIWVQESLHHAGVRAVEVTALQARLDSATSILATQSTLLDENLRLRDLLDLRERAGPAFVPASAIRSGTRGSESMFLLDVGTEDGVQVNDPVISARGLVGVVREVGPRTALALDWTHPDFRVSVMTLDGEGFGIVEPRHGAFREEDRLLLTGVPYHSELEEGAVLVTSGQGIHPRGILVGEVQALADMEAGWHRSYWVRPAVRPGSVTHVLVLTSEEGVPPGELRHLWEDGEADTAGTAPETGPAAPQGDGAGEPDPGGGVEGEDPSSRTPTAEGSTP